MNEPVKIIFCERFDLDVAKPEFKGGRARSAKNTKRG